jgi:hypothetical protein
MSTRARTLSLLLLSPLALGGQCKQDDTAGDLPDCEPVANAGEDQSVSFGSVATVNGCAPEHSLECDGVDYTYVWSFESIPVDSNMDESLLSDNNAASACETSFTPDAVGTYVLSMVMNDGQEDTEPDLVIVQVSSGNQPPVAICEAPPEVEVGERAEFDGSASYDPEGAALEFSWALSAWPADSDLDASDIFNANSEIATIIPDASGVYLVSLVVSDGSQWSEPTYCTAGAASENQVPIADAGMGITFSPCADAVIRLNGYGSYDPEGQPLEYQWSVLEVPPGSHADGSLDSGDSGPAGAPAFDDPTSPTPEFAWDVIGTYVFQLSVFDGIFWSAPDVVSYVVPDPSTNTAPTANAGEDVSVSAETECDLVSYGVHECDPCAPETVELDGSMSLDNDGDEISFYWSDASGELFIHTPYGSYTQVTTPELVVSLGTTESETWTVDLEVSDCMYSDTDSANVTFTCEATY